MTITTKKISIALFAAAGIAAAAFAYGDSVSISNNIQSSASTGGNTAGTVVNGSASASVHISQTINGVTQPPIDIATTSQSGSISVSVESVTVNTSTASTSVKIEKGPAAEANAAMISTATPKPKIIYAVVPPVITAPNAFPAPPPPLPPSFVSRIASFFKTLFAWIPKL